MTKKILVVDDDDETRVLTTLRLQTAHYEVVTAADGREGLQQASAHRPDLVVLDLLMPGMHGFEACQRLRECYSGLKILILSGKAFTVDARSALRLGADKVLRKPCEEAVLIAAVRELLGEGAPS